MSDDEVWGEEEAAAEELEEEMNEDYSDTELEEELKLPADLRSLSTGEKIDLLKFKRTHNEIEWEEELLNRTDQLRKFRDLEELTKTLRENKPSGKASSTKTPAAKAKATKPPSRAAKKKVVAESEAEEDDEDVEDVTFDEDEDGWFGEDEVEMISAQTSTRLKSKRSAQEEDGAQVSKKRGRASVKRKSRLDEYSEEEDSDDNFDDYDEEELLPRRGRGGNKRVREKDREEDGSRMEVVKEPSPPAGLEDLHKIQIRRFQMVNALYEPYFEKSIKGAFVRVFEAKDSNNNDYYKMGCIVDVRKYKREYVVTATDINSSKKKCDLVLCLDDGSGVYEKWTDVKLTQVSNSKITQEEFDRYVTHALDSKGQVDPPTLDDVNEVRKRLRSASEHVYGVEEVLGMVRSGRVQKSHLTEGTSMVIDKLDRRMAQAREANDLTKMEEIGKKLVALRREEKKRKDIHQKQAKITSVNDRNKAFNEKMDVEASKRKREEKSAGVQAAESNPFARRETRPKILWVTGKNKDVLEEQVGEKPLAVQTQASEAEVPKKSVVRTPSASYSVLRDSIETISARIKERINVDPLAESRKDKRDRYLSRICKNLPPTGSSRREKMRRGLSIDDWMSLQGDVQNDSENVE